MAIGYCASCGMRKKLRHGMCHQCSDDMRKGKQMRNVDFPLTIDGIISHARRYSTYTAFAFLSAANDAMLNGSEYGW